jgi:hypothetical protein
MNSYRHPASQQSRHNTGPERRGTPGTAPKIARKGSNKGRKS